MPRPYERSEVDLRADFHEPGREYRRWREPALRWHGSGRIEALVVAQYRVRVGHVDDVDPDVVSGAPEPQDLAEPQIEGVDTVAPHLAWRHEVDRHRRADDGRRTAERCRDQSDRRIPIGRENATLIAAQCPGDR